MAQTGFTPISIYYSSTASNVPTAGNLVAGELAINTADGRLYYKDSAGVVQVIGTKGGVGSSTTTQVLYNSSGLVVGSANMTFNGTTLTLANDVSISGLTVGKGGGAVASNTALGYQATYLTTTAAKSTAVGYQSLYNATTTGDQTAVGYQALYSGGGGGDVAVGESALFSGTTAGGANTAVGYFAAYATTSGASNTALGREALRSNTTASNNTAVGYQAGYSNIIGVGLTFIGRQAGYSSTGNYNTGIGSSSLYSNTSGTDNTALGLNSLYSNTTGSFNTALGDQALLYNTTASNNTALGYQAGYAMTTGSSNTALGYSAGNTLTTGTNCTLIGYNTQVSAVGNTYELVIGATSGITGKGSSTGYIYPQGGGVYQGNNSATWSITSDARLKKNIVDNTDGLNKIIAIQVRNFEYRTADEVTELEPQNAINIKGVQLGAIAQELQAILPDCVKTESTGVMSVNSENLTWYLVNAVKELKAEIDQLKGK